MQTLFHMDNPFWRFMGKLTDLVVITILWFICCLPIFTIGASTTALYDVSMKLQQDKDGYTLKNFFTSFKKNFKQSTLIWLVLLAVGILIAGDIWFLSQLKSSGTNLLLFMLFLLTFFCLILTIYLFPLIARYETTLKNIFIMAFVLSLKNFSWSILMLTTIICFILVSLFVSAPVILISAGGTAYIHAKILCPIFLKLK